AGGADRARPARRAGSGAPPAARGLSAGRRPRLPGGLEPGGGGPGARLDHGASPGTTGERQETVARASGPAGPGVVGRCWGGRGVVGGAGGGGGRARRRRGGGAAIVGGYDDEGRGGVRGG